MQALQAKDMPAGGATYTFCSRPRVVPNRNKYRGIPLTTLEDAIQYGNIMYDRRIVRGNTYAQTTLPLGAHPDPVELQRQYERQRKAHAKKRAKEQLRMRTPEAVEGRKHVDVQTELYLEELTDRVEEADMECQTDAFLDRPATPFFIPSKTGADMSTQIEEGELFDFDIEVKPMLEVLVGKTIEQSLLEVMEEEELANLRAMQQAFEELRNSELAEVQRLEEQERRHREEKDRRQKEQREVLMKEKETADKVAARAFAQRYLADLIPSVFSNLRDNGYFYDPVERDVETGFIPWLMKEVEKTMEKSILGRTLLDLLIREVVGKRFDEQQMQAERNIAHTEPDADAMGHAQETEDESHVQSMRIGSDGQLVETEADEQQLESEGDEQQLESEGDARHSEPEGDAHHSEPEGDARHSEPEGDARHSEPGGDAHHIGPEGDTQHKEHEGDAQHTEHEGDAQHTEPDEDAPPMDPEQHGPN